jgi:hypothetical protein
MEPIYIIFTSHRARSNALREFDVKPQAYYSWHRDTSHGVYLLTMEQFTILKANKRLKGWRKLRGPYDDMMKCWS